MLRHLAMAWVLLLVFTLAACVTETATAPDTLEKSQETGSQPATPPLTAEPAEGAGNVSATSSPADQETAGTTVDAATDACMDLALDGVTLWMSRDAVLALLGDPDELTGDYDSETFSYNRLGLTVFLRSGQVTKVLESEGELPSGLKVGDPLEKAYDLYGEPSVVSGQHYFWAFESCRVFLGVYVRDGNITVLRLVQPFYHLD